MCCMKGNIPSDWCILTPQIMREIRAYCFKMFQALQLLVDSQECKIWKSAPPGTFAYIKPGVKNENSLPLRGRVYGPVISYRPHL